jgi:hypothetical protein
MLNAAAAALQANDIPGAAALAARAQTMFDGRPAGVTWTEEAAFLEQLVRAVAPGGAGSPAGGAGGAPGEEEEEDMTTTLLIGGAAAVVGFLILKMRK